MWNKNIDFCTTATLMIGLLSIAVASSDQWETIGKLSYNLKKEENFKIHDSKIFQHGPGLHVRHNLEIHLALQLHDNCDEPFKFLLTENENSTIFKWIQRPLVQNGELHFHLYVNQSIPVGSYTLNTSDSCSKETNKSVHLCDVHVMFNPRLITSSNKRVRRLYPAISDREFLDEYLYNNNGLIWRQFHIDRFITIPWDYAVGSWVVTESKRRLTQLMSDRERSDCVEYSRALTKLINEHVLYGRWDRNYYQDGYDPSVWVDSTQVLDHWLLSRQRVRYVQCWVFAAILTTILRATGIPARTVTNYNSHHDRGVMLKVDSEVYIRPYDNIIQPDEIQWNYHVWTEAWLERQDLGLGEPADWNALDATPQEPSPLEPYQPYRAGPAYLPYIQANRKYANYDTYFIIAEVNARGKCPLTGMSLPPFVGYPVVTKLMGRHPAAYDSNNPEYLTNNYKIESISKRSSDNSSRELFPSYDTGCERDGGMRLNITPTNPMVGEDFTITVSEGNVSVEDTVIRMELRNYRGDSLGIIGNFTGIRQLNVTEDDYMPYLSFTTILRFSVGEYNSTGGFVFHDYLSITLEYNQLGVQATRVANSDTITLTLTYTNPLSVPMTGVMVSISNPNNTYIMMNQSDIPAKSRFTMAISVECGDNNDTDVMIPISLDSDVTQSVYGTGWSSCRKESSSGGIIMLPEIFGLLFCLFALSLCI